MTLIRCLFPLILGSSLVLAGAPARIAEDSHMVLRQIVVPDHPSALERLAVEKLTGTARSVFGLDLPAVRASAATSLEDSVVLGTPPGNPLLRELSLDGLSREGFLIQTVSGPRGRFVALAASDSAGVFHGANYLADFIMQSAGRGLALQTATVRRDSPIRLRGTYNLVCWGLAPRYTRQHWEKVIDAMAEDGITSSTSGSPASSARSYSRKVSSIPKPRSPTTTSAS